MGQLGPSAGAPAEIRRLAGPSAGISRISRLEGGQRSRTWRVDTRDPESSVVVREFPALARSDTDVETWEPSYAPLGRPDLDPAELRRRHDDWTAHLFHPA